jgi:hypothetical protein
MNNLSTETIEAMIALCVAIVLIILLYWIHSSTEPQRKQPNLQDWNDWPVNGSDDLPEFMQCANCGSTQSDKDGQICKRCGSQECIEIGPRPLES